jgi:Leucine-rich repeat (LRR) protein
MRLVLTHSIPEKLLWINLSFNCLNKIDVDLMNFPNLKTLLLHGNFIYEMEEVRKLQNLTCLQSLTLNGNPIEEIKGYRAYVLGMMFAHCETLKKLDNVMVSNQEFDSCIVWNERFKNSTKIKKLKVDNPKQPPKPMNEDNSKKPNTANEKRK